MQPQRKMVVSKKLMKVGPWGGAGGHPWDDGGHSGIRSITMSYDRCIDSISVEYDRDGQAVPGERHGGAGGNHTTQIKLSFPDEYLTTVSGHYSPIAPGGSPVIRSLEFRTNQRAYGPFGVAEGTPFTFPVDGGVIVGLCGRSGWQLDAVGLYVAPLRPETMYDKVQKLGLTAYRAVKYRIGPQQQQHEDEQVRQQKVNAQLTHKT
ncbi:jacalin-related lectin 19-like isoform X2 [Phragmites australis]|uniref:jacalin-related lectin 19-like isoform X2 n=1 Tax=Phragmites australis TaxID=29695 RepID=UPI002D769273|nr:jacalin-related lectin 19-like isoform X2 [Phragmites australis]